MPSEELNPLWLQKETNELNPEWLVKTGAPEPSLLSPQEAKGVLRAIAKGLVVGGPAAAGATLAVPAMPATGLAAPYLGAVIGAATGQAGWQAIEPVLPETVFGPSEEKRSLPEQFREIGEEAMYGPIYEAGGRTAAALLERAAAPFARGITAAGQRTLDFLKRAGTRPAVTDIRSAPFLRRMEGTAAKMFGGGRIAKQGEEELRAVYGSKAEEIPGYAQKKAERVLEPPAEPRPGQRLSELVELGEPAAGAKGIDLEATTFRGERVMTDLRRMVREAKDELDIAYPLMRAKQNPIPDFTIDKLADAASESLQKSALVESFLARGETSAQLRRPGGKYYPPETKPKVPKSRVTGEAGFGAPPEGMEYDPTVYHFDPNAPPPPTTPTPPPGAGFYAQGIVRDPAEGMVKKIAQMKGMRVPFAEVDAMLEHLGQLGEGSPVYRKLKGALKDDTATWAQTPGNRPIKDEYINVTQRYKREVVPFKADQPLGRFVAEGGEPVRAMDYLLAPRDLHIESLRAVHAQTGGKGAAWMALQEEQLARAINNPRSIKNIGVEKTKLLFPAEEQQQLLKDLDTYATVSRAKERAKRGELAFTGQGTVSINQALGGLVLLARPLMTAGGAYGAYQAGQYTGYPTTGAIVGGAILLGPNVLARMLTNPTTAKWLSEGLRTPPGTPEAMRVAAQILPRYYEALGRQKSEMPGIRSSAPALSERLKAISQ